MSSSSPDSEDFQTTLNNTASNTAKNIVDASPTSDGMSADTALVEADVSLSTADQSPLDALWALLDDFDDNVNDLIEKVRGNPYLDRLCYAASELGDHSLIWHLIGTARAASNMKNEASSLRLLTALAIESGLVNGVVKSMFNRSRPIPEFDRPLRLRIPRTSSFPSGHASSAAMAALLLSDRSKLKPAYLSLAGLIAFSRMYVRIHHASDVAGGLVLGSLLARGVKRISPLK